MKALGIVSLSLALSCSMHAALVKFQLSPSGTDVAVGLSPSNAVPPATTSTGAGGELAGGIVFDTDSSLLQLAVGYGSAAGFANLTGPATTLDIHGPAGPGTNAGVLVDLLPYSFPAANPATGGVIVGTLAWPTNATAALLAGETYLDLHTTLYPGGELRGQLIPVNEAPLVACPPEATVACGTATPLVTLLSDPEGDALSVVWTINGLPVATNTVPARQPGYPAMDTLTPSLPLGTNQIEVAVTDTAGNHVSCASQIIVADTTPPVIVSAAADPAVLWPPNHKWVDVTVHATVTDTCSATTWKIIAVSSNEAVNAKGSGHTAPDWTLTGDHTLKLRAERAGGGSGRIYTITVQAKDAAGNRSQPKSVTVTVAKSQGQK